MAIDRVLSTWEHRERSIQPGDLFDMDDAPIECSGKPDCYVNESGGVVKQWLDALNLSPGSLLVIYDDFSLDLGSIRLRPSGRSGGHRGLQNIIDTCGTDQIPRLRIGIGPLPSGDAPEDFVLSPIANTDREQLHSVFNVIPDTLQSIEDDGMDSAMSRWNGSTINA
jgi:PTH1 family peptidyl-tRNA hydrolase